MNIAFHILSLGISVATLVYLIKYVRATNIIAKQSTRQVEATFRPALVCIAGLSLEHGPKLRNIGTGPAIEIEWFFATSRKDKIPYLEPSPDPYSLRYFDGMKPLFETAEPIVLKYKSISGAIYSSTCKYDIHSGEFSTTFSELST